MSSAYTEQDCKDSSGEPIEVKLIAAASNGLVEVTPEKCERVGKLIRSYAALARAGMREACAGHTTVEIPEEESNIVISRWACSCGKLVADGVTKWKILWEAHVRSLPDTAADEAIERIHDEAHEVALSLAAEQIIGALREGGNFAEGSPLAKVMQAIERIKAEAESPWRRLLWLNHSRYLPHEHMPYGDDGEMQCCGIDFKRDSSEAIERYLVMRIAALEGKEPSHD